MSKVTIAWECVHCGHRHLWVWLGYDAMAGQITMTCDACSNRTKGKLCWIGNECMALIW
jgi:transcription elongation factor Elf1